MNKKIISIASLIFVAAIGFISYYTEVMINGWEGLKWTGNFYWTFILLPLVFCIWLKLVAVKTLSVKQAVLFLISYVISFILIFLLLFFTYNGRSTGLILFMLTEGIPHFEESGSLMHLLYATIAINVILTFFVAFAENMIAAKIFNIKFSKRAKVLVFFLPALFFLAAWALLIVLYFLKVFPRMNPNNLSESIFIFKTGTIIFTSVLGEGLFIVDGRKLP